MKRYFCARLQLVTTKADECRIQREQRGSPICETCTDELIEAIDDAHLALLRQAAGYQAARRGRAETAFEKTNWCKHEGCNRPASNKFGYCSKHWGELCSERRLKKRAEREAEQPAAGDAENPASAALSAPQKPLVHCCIELSRADYLIVMAYVRAAGADSRHRSEYSTMIGELILDAAERSRP